MKRIAFILLILLYMIPILGLSVSVHYCGNKIASTSFNPFNTGHKCPCGSKQMKKDCCKDEVAFFKLDDEQQKRQHVLFNFDSVIDLSCIVASNLNFDNKNPLLSINFDHRLHPPNDLKHPLYIRHSVFRI